jgi:hypothetical protein
VTGFLGTTVQSYIHAIEMLPTLSRSAARTDAVERFDKSVMATRYLALYEDVLAGKEW